MPSTCIWLWKPRPSEVPFIADTSRWQEQAKHFAAFVPKVKSNIANGWLCLGLRRPGLRHERV